MSYTIESIAEYIGARRVGEHEATIDWLLTDSRSLSFPEETLFFALPTKRNNGARYISELYDRGVRNFVVTEEDFKKMENGEWAAQQNEQLLAINPLLSNSQLSTLNTQLTPLHFQEELERQCWLQGGRRQTAPAQRMLDFTRKKLSYDLPESSYSPGLISSPLHFWMPSFISKRLSLGFQQFGRSSHGFLTNEAVMIGVETRTSSPVRIIRDKDTLQHVTVRGLFPCGEGAGYAGGIVSAGVDGERCAEAAANYFNHNSIFYIGRNLDYALGLEGSLKLKEISYIHSESYAAGELKHGTISLIEPGTLVVALATYKPLVEKSLSNIVEVKSRGAEVIALTTELTVNQIGSQASEMFVIPKTHLLLQPVLGVIPLQLFAYYVALNRGCDIDKPRNLAKSVTVE